jgi:hypothetical protein
MRGVWVVLVAVATVFPASPAGAAPVACSEQPSVLLCDADGDTIADVVEEAVCGSATCATGTEDLDGSGVPDAEEFAASLRSGGPGGPVRLESPSSLLVVGADGSVTTVDLWLVAGAAGLFLAAVAALVLYRRRSAVVERRARHRLKELVS